MQQPTFLHLVMQAKMITLTCKEALEVTLHVSRGHGLFNKGLRSLKVLKNLRFHSRENQGLPKRKGQK